MKRASALLFFTSAIVSSASLAYAQHATVDDQELMTKLRQAAPAHVLEQATVMNTGHDGKMKVIQEGNNGWTCMDPGGAPMCADKAAMEWVEAWQSKGPAPKTGSHVMIVGAEAKSMMQGYPRDAKADPNKPYVMWPGTPYEHLMLPTK